MEQQVNIRTIRHLAIFFITFLIMEFMQNGIFLQQAMAKVHVMELVALL